MFSVLLPIHQEATWCLVAGWGWLNHDSSQETPIRDYLSVCLLCCAAETCCLFGAAVDHNSNKDFLIA